MNRAELENTISTEERGRVIGNAMMMLRDSYTGPDAVVVHPEDHAAVTTHMKTVWATYPAPQSAEMIGGVRIFTADRWLSRGQAVAVWLGHDGRMERVERIEWAV